VLHEDQLAGGAVLFVDPEHALFDQSRQVAPAAQALVIDGLLEAVPERRVHIGGERREQCRHAGEEVVDGRGRNAGALRHRVHR